MTALLFSGMPAPPVDAPSSPNRPRVTSRLSGSTKNGLYTIEPAVLTQEVIDSAATVINGSLGMNLPGLGFTSAQMRSGNTGRFSVTSVGIDDTNTETQHGGTPRQTSANPLLLPDPRAPATPTQGSMSSTGKCSVA